MDKCVPVSGAPKRVLWTPTPETTKKVKFPDRDVQAKGMLPRDLSLVNADRFRRSQAENSACLLYTSPSPRD